MQLIAQVTSDRIGLEADVGASSRNGAVFQDAFPGKFKVADWAKHEVVPVEQIPAQVIEGARAIPPEDVSSDEPWEADQPLADGREV